MFNKKLDMKNKIIIILIAIIFICFYAYLFLAINKMVDNEIEAKQTEKTRLVNFIRSQHVLFK
jgi:Tfp pilus assembly protein PilO